MVIPTVVRHAKGTAGMGSIFALSRLNYFIGLYAKDYTIWDRDIEASASRLSVQHWNNWGKTMFFFLIFISPLFNLKVQLLAAVSSFYSNFERKNPQQISRCNFVLIYSACMHVNLKYSCILFSFLTESTVHSCLAKNGFCALIPPSTCLVTTCLNGWLAHSRYNGGSRCCWLELAT